MAYQNIAKKARRIFLEKGNEKIDYNLRNLIEETRNVKYLLLIIGMILLGIFLRMVFG